MQKIRRMSSTVRFWILTAAMVGSPVLVSALMFGAALIGLGDRDTAERALVYALGGSIGVTLFVDGMLIALRRAMGGGFVWWVLAPLVYAALMLMVWGNSMGADYTTHDLAMSALGAVVFVLNWSAVLGRLKTLARFADGL